MKTRDIIDHILWLVALHEEGRNDYTVKNYLVTCFVFKNKKKDSSVSWNQWHEFYAKISNDYYSHAASHII